MPSPMERPHPHLLRTVVAAIAVGLTNCAGAQGVESDSTQIEFDAPASASSASADVDTALARVDAVRSRADEDSLALEDALTALGDAYVDAHQYTSAAASYNKALHLAEQHTGLENERVLAPLLGLANALAASGHHQQAVLRLQRALAIQRAQYGLFDVSQQETLKTLAASLTALDRVSEAQDLMIYRARVAEKTYGEGSTQVIPTLCDLGSWFADVGMSPEAHLAFQTALNIAGDKSSLNAPIIIEPLRGIARAHMLRVSYPEAWLRPRSPPSCFAIGQECRPPYPHDADGHLIVEPRKLDPEGEHALQRALRVLEADPGAWTQTHIETLLQLGDWHQIKKSPSEALPYYQRAWRLIHQARNLPNSAASALNVPLRVYYPTPQIVAHTLPQSVEETRSHYVQLEFTVEADGSVSDAHIVDQDTRDRYAGDVLDAVRASRFRPKFVDGHPVATPGIPYREVFWTAKARE
jgi:tetratricopeptide (TPR) repeat protein